VLNAAGSEQMPQVVMGESVRFRFCASSREHPGALCDRDNVAVMHSLSRLVEARLQSAFKNVFVVPLVMRWVRSFC
jgi:hypothetical protein